MVAPGCRPSLAQGCRDAGARARSVVRREGTRDGQTGVVVAAADQTVASVQVEGGGTRMALGVPGHRLGSQAAEDPAQRVFMSDVARPIPYLEVAKHEQATLEVVRLQPSVYLRQGMAERKFNTLVVKIRHQLVDVRAQPLDLLVLRFRDVDDYGVDDAAVLGKARRHLLTDEGIVGERAELEGAVDGVVITQCDQVHPAGLGRRVDRGRARVALGGARRSKKPAVRSIGEAGMNVKIDLHRAFEAVGDRRDSWIHGCCLLASGGSDALGGLVTNARQECAQPRSGEMQSSCGAKLLPT